MLTTGHYAHSPQAFPAYSLGRNLGATFQEIADELGFSVVGAKMAVDAAIEKARYLAKLPRKELDVAILSAMSDYVDTLAKTGELTDDDVQLVRDNPGVVVELDGFREFFHKQLKRMQREDRSE